MITFKIPLLLIILFLVACLSGTQSKATSVPDTSLTDTPSELPEPVVLREWVSQMKQHKRGPFKRIRWFCNDGSILPPRPYACREHGGGVQHGEWTDQVKLLRQHNFLIGNLLADLSRETFFQPQQWRDHLQQIILEQFLRETDDGWIFRKTRYYRGAIQTEDENWHGRSLLLGLLQQPELKDRHFLLLREAVRFLPHGQSSPALVTMRQLSQSIAERDPAFSPLRIKLHSQPEASDEFDVLRYAETGLLELQKDYQQLAVLIEQATTPQNDAFADAIDLQISHDTQLIATLSGAKVDIAKLPTEVRYARASQLLFLVRTELDPVANEEKQLQWLDLSLRLEQELFRTANQLLGKLSSASRRQQLAWIELGIDALYGTGMFSKREWKSLHESLQILFKKPLLVESYHREITHLSRSTRWAENRLRYHFDSPVKRLASLDSAFRNYVPERLRSSPLLPISSMIDSLQADSQALQGVSHQLFGMPTPGLQPLNPGLARGRLEIVTDPHQHHYSADGIYLLPETVEDLPPVAGILTRGAGNALSHIQLLARNLGIPNIAVSNKLQTELAEHQGEMIVIAASPGGVVRTEKDSEYWQEIFRQKQQLDFLIEPDLRKLDLRQRDILMLNQLRAADSGRIAGPKGANLGELKQHYGDLIPDALIIPFGRFAQFLEQTTAPDGQSLFDWMIDNYRQLDADPDDMAQSAFLAQLRDQIINAPFDQDFLVEIQTALEKNFGPDGSYGVFVRSDTNVEDLPNFTGAGLNKTVPHVVGFDNIIQAIKTVWASPFTDRAFRWRQAHMRTPEHLYASVLLMLSVPADKSGVMATMNQMTGDKGGLQIAVNEGVGGAVSGQRAEELLIDQHSGKVRLLAQASADQKRILLPQGGIEKVPATAPEQLLSDEEIIILRQMADDLPTRFPELRNTDGSNKPADIEFGFLNSQFILFQIRPLVESKRVRKDLLLQQLDRDLSGKSSTVDLRQLSVGSQL